VLQNIKPGGFTHVLQNKKTWRLTQVLQNKKPGGLLAKDRQYNGKKKQ
jgi:hypothetical protein